MRIIKFCLTLFLFLSVSELVSMEAVNGVLLSSKVVFAEKSSVQFRTLFRGFLTKINANPVGRKLFGIIKASLLESAAKDIDFLIIEETTGNIFQNTAFSHGLDFEKNKEIPENFKTITGGRLYLYVNLDNAVKCCIPSTDDSERFFSESECIYKKISIISISENTTAYPVSKIYSPFYVTIVHEFIHFKHFLDTYLKKEKIVDLGHAATIRTYRDMQMDSRLSPTMFPELSEINLFSEEDPSKVLSFNALRRYIPWNDLEERRTVCGPDINQISEVAFRIAEGLPIRYIYQGQNFFLEDPVIAERIIGDVIASAFPSKTLKDVLDTLPDGFYSFGIEKNSFEDGFKYSPLSIRLSLFTNDEIIEKANIKKNKDSIRDWLIKYRAALAEHAASSSSLP